MEIDLCRFREAQITIEIVDFKIFLFCIKIAVMIVIVDKDNDSLVLGSNQIMGLLKNSIISK